MGAEIWYWKNQAVLRLRSRAAFFIGKNMPWSKDNLPDAVKGKNWSDAQIEAFVKTANAILEETGDEGKAISIAISQVEEKKNAKQFPQVFYAKHLEAGHATYDNETILLDNPTLIEMAKSFVGKPVFAGQHEKVELDNLQEQADGYVVESFFNTDGWLWVKFIAVSDASFEAIARGWGVSNAYIPTEFEGAGTHHNTPYDRKIVNGYFTHLAIVEFPRYEESKILTPEEFKAYQEETKAKLSELHNSKPQPQKTEGKSKMFSIFKTKKEEVAQISPDAQIELENGKTVSILEMVNALKKNEDEGKKEEKESPDMEMEIEIDGEAIPLKELVNRYKNAMKKNSDEEAKKEDEKSEEEDKSKENEDKEEKKEEDEKTNSKDFFTELRNAHSTQGKAVSTSMDSISRGKSRYGSAS